MTLLRTSARLQWSPCYAPVEIVGSLLLLLLLLLFDASTQFLQNEIITLCNTIKYKNQAGMNLTPPPSQKRHVVRWHCTAESHLLLLLNSHFTVSKFTTLLSTT